MIKNQKIKIELTQEEGLVLLEFLEELDKKNKIKRKADKRIVWDLIALIEKQSQSVINNPNYVKDLEKARKKLSKTVSP